MLKTILDFSDDDKLKNYKFESDFIRSINTQGSFFGEESLIFKFKNKLSIKRVPKPKKKTIEFAVMINCIYPDNENEMDFDVCFKTQDKAIEFFLGKVEELKFLRQKDKENILFDNQRYFWRVEDNKIKEKVIC